jgi:hypothetical protein
MRTTVTIDHDVEQLVREAMQQTGQSFKVTLNQAIRKGLAGTLVPRADEPPFVVSPYAMGLRAGVDPARLQQLDDDLEVDSFLAVTGKLLRKSKTGGRRKKAHAKSRNSRRRT